MGLSFWFHMQFCKKHNGQWQWERCFDILNSFFFLFSFLVGTAVFVLGSFVWEYTVYVSGFCVVFSTLS